MADVYFLPLLRILTEITLPSLSMLTLATAPMLSPSISIGGATLYPNPESIMSIVSI